MIKHIVFDFDGTLANTKTLIPKIVNEVLAMQNREQMTLDEIHEMMNKHTKQVIKESGLKWYQVPKFVLCAQKIMHHMTDDILLYDGIENMCLELDKKYVTNIISANSVENIEKVLKKHNLNCFDHIFSTKGKPKKHKLFSKYMKQFDLQPDEILYVGDELSDIIACKKKNIKIASVTWGYDSVEILRSSEPDHILHTPIELLDIVKQYG